ncbi:hypothetical protein BP6252_08344 [Coleophoma cylindrospora]|uniref:Mucoidy inhibitor-like protein n=1 Tax=Coleophoma cylindrospora TaxID=1849047 RepID=A0A3D8R690_9HELO|nr:hypothetical protein BP6252_08344 [Coleophoma cylindrospora]
MAIDTSHKQEFRIRNLDTRSVILYPNRAQIIRDIKGITLKPGANQIIIDGLAPTVDKHSIKVEGTGAATITDLAVDYLPNREHYEDIYPSDSDDDDSDEDDDSSDNESAAVKAITEKIRQLNRDLADEKEKADSATSRLALLDNYSHSVKNDRPSDLDTVLKLYRDEREKVYAEHSNSTSKSNEIQVQINKTLQEQRKALNAATKAKLKSRKEKIKLQEKKTRQKAEIAKEKARIKRERESFWARDVYRITVTLEPASYTPGSSRRSSMDSDTLVKLAPESPGKIEAGELNLTLSYVTYEAFWSPRYDLSLDTLKNSGILDYGAELVNTTSEIWRDAKVILSTSQTTFSGLSETIPTLHPWHVRLVKLGYRDNHGGLFSQSEMASNSQQKAIETSRRSKPRHEMFGRDISRNVFGNPQAFVPHAPTVNQAPVAYGAATGSLFGNASAGGLFGSSQAAPQQMQQMQRMQQMQQMPQMKQQRMQQQQATGFGSTGHATSSLFGSAAPQAQPQALHSHGGIDEDEDEDEDEAPRRSAAAFDYTSTLVEPTPQLQFEEGAWEESGMTTTYDVPGLKTIEPSNSTVKHKIAKIEFKKIVFSHIIIGKLRQVAFLKARVCNSSKITLLKGPLGLTLDGSFLGQGLFPRCSSGESFSLPLGVDPAITVGYPKPTIQRSQSGIFSKEDSNIFNRTVIITNTKPNSAVDITVLDQVPISEDERLKIDIAFPRGLKIGGDKIKTGASSGTATSPSSALVNQAAGARASVHGLSSNGKEVGPGKWGTAEATAKKNGEVAWNVKLNPGQGVKLVLEYEASFPAGESIAGA